MVSSTTLLKARDAEPIPGYRLVEPIGRGGYGEVWKCVAPGGLYKAIKFVPGKQDELDTSPGAAAEELRSVERIKAIRHPFLLSMERVENIHGELVIVMELADKSLKDRLAERQSQGYAGIEREELLGYLREAADVLDLMRTRYNLQHLDIKPANLFLVSDHIKVADFGLVQSLSERTGQTPASPLGAVTPRYAAPELFRGKLSPASDQFSLALVYQEMLTGGLPFQGKNFRQLMLQHTTGEADLTQLPESDRPIVARALAKDPKERYPSCREFIAALAEIESDATAQETRADLVVQTQAVGPEIGPCLPDLQFTGCLGRTPTGEAWSARGEDGRLWVVQLLYGLGGRHPRQDEQSVQRLQAIQHPALPTRRVALADRGCFVVASELHELNLRARYQEARVRGGMGLSRGDLLNWLWGVADALDQLHETHGLPHGGLHPRNLLCEGNRLLISEFGLLPLLYRPAAQLSAVLQPRYAAPEAMDGSLSRACDVYSLAVIYQEMLSGTHPHRGRPATAGAAPQLQGLPASDRVAVARALQADPRQRFGSCLEFLTALAGGAPVDQSFRGSGPPESAVDAGEAVVARTPDPAARLARLIEDAAASVPPVEPPEWTTEPDGSPCLQARLPVSLPPTGGVSRFEGFRQRWQADLLSHDDRSAVFQIEQSRGFWARLRGGRQLLQVALSWTCPIPPLAAAPELVIRIRPAERGDRSTVSVIREIGPAIVDNLRQQFLGSHERRRKERVLWARPVLATFLLGDAPAGAPVECLGKDLSVTGMGLYLPTALAGADVRLNLTPDQENDPVIVAGQFVRVQRCGNGWYEAGVLFQ